MGTSATRAKNKYNATNYDHVHLLLEKGQKDILKAVADKHDISLNQLINNAITEYVSTLDKKMGLSH